MIVGEYMRNELTQTLHIGIPGSNPFPDRTLCGLDIMASPFDWHGVDETASGHAADCKRCKTIFRNRAEKAG
jgi:hypothetical protein